MYFLSWPTRCEALRRPAPAPPVGRDVSRPPPWPVRQSAPIHHLTYLYAKPGWRSATLPIWTAVAQRGTSGATAFDVLTSPQNLCPIRRRQPADSREPVSARVLRDARKRQLHPFRVTQPHSKSATLRITALGWSPPCRLVSIFKPLGWKRETRHRPPQRPCLQLLSWEKSTQSVALLDDSRHSDACFAARSL
jgi:hypothetical protein